LSLLPSEDLVRTGLDGRVEHFCAYFATILVVTAAYADGVVLGVLTGRLALYAGALEIGQVWSAGRHPSVLDFAASVAGIALGSLLLFATRRIARRLPPGG
jgi:VanZ family protein